MLTEVTELFKVGSRMVVSDKVNCSFTVGFLLLILENLSICVFHKNADISTNDNIFQHFPYILIFQRCN